MSYEVKLVGHEVLTQAMAEIDTDLVASEVQGIAFGFVCLKDMRQAEMVWAKFILDEFQEVLEDPKYIPFLEMMGHLFRGCQADLFSGEYGITLCLPDDETAFAARAAALSAWCKGFMYGLGIAGKPEVLNTEDIQDALSDLSEMIDLDYDEQDELQNEAAFVELIEYVRLVPVMIFQNQAAEQKEETIH